MTQGFDLFINGGAPLSPWVVTVRLVLALVLGGVVTWLYKATRHTPVESSFPTTLVLLSVLIAMVTQVIGDNIARAFSLVGALSIVRFRTAVRDTEDTAYVIFAVVVGMAVGAGHVWVATLGMGVVALGAFVMLRTRRVPSLPVAVYTLIVSLDAGREAHTALMPALGPHAAAAELRGITSTSTGSSVDLTYEVRLRTPDSLQPLAVAVSRVDGVRKVDLQRLVAVLA